MKFRRNDVVGRGYVDLDLDLDLDNESAGSGIQQLTIRSESNSSTIDDGNICIEYNCNNNYITTVIITK